MLGRCHRATGLNRRSSRVAQLAHTERPLLGEYDAAAPLADPDSMTSESHDSFRDLGTPPPYNFDDVPTHEVLNLLPTCNSNDECSLESGSNLNCSHDQNNTTDQPFSPTNHYTKDDSSNDNCVIANEDKCTCVDIKAEQGNHFVDAAFLQSVFTQRYAKLYTAAENKHAPPILTKHSQLRRLSTTERLTTLTDQIKGLPSMIYHYIANHISGTKPVETEEPEEQDRSIVRHTPEGLESLIRQTKFTRKEIQMMYRGFKQGCPVGIVNLEQFREIFAQFFPQGDARQYASFVFNTFDIDGNGHISFGELVKGLSVLSRGTIEDKLSWIFALYDIERDGHLSKDEIFTVTNSIYAMMGKHTEPSIASDTAQSHANHVFEKLDKRNTGIVSIDTFMDACRTDETISRSIGSFDTVL